MSILSCIMKRSRLTLTVAPAKNVGVPVPISGTLALAPIEQLWSIGLGLGTGFFSY